MRGNEMATRRSHRLIADEDGWWVNANRRLRNHGRPSFIRNKVSDFDRVMQDKATSFFFTNFPDSWDSSALWKMFSRYGKVVDVYVAFKRTKPGTKFGFVMFINIDNLESFENRLKCIMIGETKIVINRAKFFKGIINNRHVDRSDKNNFAFRKEDFPPVMKNVDSKNKTGSFRDVVGGSKPKAPTAVDKCINVVEDADIRSELDKCWIGKAKNFEVLRNAWEFVKSNGLEECKLKYLGGGLSFLFEWSSIDAAKDGLEANKVWLHQWFDDLKFWEDNGDSHGRLAWINLEGLPILARNLQSVKSIVMEIRLVLEVGRLDFDSPVIQSVNTLIFLPYMTEVNQVIKVKLNKNVYSVYVSQDHFQTRHFISSHLPVSSNISKGNLD
ncbi:nucleotide-binding alpha-beta plait domain-containing protein, partial [Tanacetum coccineum]